eukprot:GFUD01005980.1.p1 GENE.GFUD01005980.1~~GFUD01005980.1.p1  ORF type:complete len:414 (+),score=84.52 GFUD01005980.1:60-1301(+)
MTFRLEAKTHFHSTNLLTSLQTLSNDQPDLLLLTAGGACVQTHQLLLAMFSPFVNNILESFTTSETPAISLPVQESSELINLIKLLSSGKAYTQDSGALRKVVRVADLLGISLNGLHQDLVNRGLYQPEKEPKSIYKLISRIDMKEAVRAEESQPREQFAITNVTGADSSPVNTEETVDDLNSVFIVEDDPDDDVDLEAEIHADYEGSNDTYEESLQYSYPFKYQDGRRFNGGGPQSNKTCGYCAKSFCSRQAMDRHILAIHSSERPFRCGVCKRGYKTSFNMKQHMAHCTEVDRYLYQEYKPPGLVRNPRICKVCGNQFATNQSLERHMKLHTGEKPYKCEVCEKCFRDQFGLKQHMITHSESKPYSCHCGSSFTVEASLRRHLFNVHKIGQVEEEVVAGPRSVAGSTFATF